MLVIRGKTSGSETGSIYGEYWFHGEDDPKSCEGEGGAVLQYMSINGTLSASLFVMWRKPNKDVFSWAQLDAATFGAQPTWVTVQLLSLTCTKEKELSVYRHELAVNTSFMLMWKGLIEECGYTALWNHHRRGEAA